MKKFVSIAVAAALASAIALPSAAQADETATAAPKVEVTAGKMLYGPNNTRIASIYRVTPEGNPQVIIDGRLLTVPASTLSDVGGKIVTSLTKREIMRGS